MCLLFAHCIRFQFVHSALFVILTLTILYYFLILQLKCCIFKFQCKFTTHCVLSTVKKRFCVFFRIQIKTIWILEKLTETIQRQRKKRQTNGTFQVNWWTEGEENKTEFMHSCLYWENCQPFLGWLRKNCRRRSEKIRDERRRGRRKKTRSLEVKIFIFLVSFFSIEQQLWKKTNNSTQSDVIQG